MVQVCEHDDREGCIAYDGDCAANAPSSPVALGGKLLASTTRCRDCIFSVQTRRTGIVKVAIRSRKLCLFGGQSIHVHEQQGREEQRHG